MNFYRKLIVSILLLMATLISQDMTTIAVMDLDPRGLSEYEAASLTDRIRTNLVGLRLFEVVDRGNMEAILKEQDFQLSGCTSSECVVEVGKLLGVRKILAGSVGKIGTFYTLELNITDVESGRIERSSSYEVEGNVGHLLKGSENALQKLLGLTVSAERGVISTERRAQSSENGAGSRAGGRLVIESKPPGAVLTMDGNDMGKTPFNMQNVPPGSHTIRLSKNDFQDMNAFIDVKVGEINRFNYDLKSIFGGIEINCAIKDANIYFDDKLRRISSFPDYRIPRGVYMLRIEHPHYSSFETTLNIISGDTVRVKPELKRIVGDIEVEVEADPSTALRARGEAELAHRSLGEGEIFINGGLIGKGSASLNNIKPGVYQLSVKKNKYYTHNEKLTLKAGEKITKTIKLKPMTGNIVADINPAQNHSILFGNKKYLQQQTLNKEKILIGNYNFKVSAPGYYPLSDKVGISENKITVMNIVLKSARADFDKAKSFYEYGKYAGMGGAAFTAISYFMAEKAYSNYQDSRIEVDTESYRSQTELWDKMKVVGLSVSLGSGIFTMKKLKEMKRIARIAGM